MSAHAPIKLEFSQGYAQVEALHGTLKDVLAAGSGDVTLDGRDVEQIDLSTLQLLAAFRRDAVAQERTVTWKGASDRLTRAARVTGLHAAIGLEDSI